MPSNFTGHPTGYADKQPEKVLLDMSPEQYNINYPPESKIPLGSLDMQRQSNSFQQTQNILHRRAREQTKYS